MIKIFVDNKEIEFKKWNFPAGEVGVMLSHISHEQFVRVEVFFPNSDEIMTMFNIFDSLRVMCIPKSNVTLILPYFPYARQDRVCKPGESLALHVFCRMLNGLGHFGHLLTADLHSYVANYLLKDCKKFVHTDIPQGMCANLLPVFDFLIAPDKGAVDKVKNHAQVMDATNPTKLIYFEKTRTDTGIFYIHTQLDMFQGTACVVDDICDGGETFLQLGKMLKATQPNLKISLYVTHGIFSNPAKLNELLTIYETIYTSYVMNDSVKHLVKVI